MDDIKINKNQIIVLFKLDEVTYGLHLSAVERVVNAVEITPLPMAPEIVMGVINFQGNIIPVMNLRKRFNLPLREIEPEDQLVIAHMQQRLVMLPVDTVSGIHELESYQLSDKEGVLVYTDYLSDIAKIDDDIVLIHDLEKFLLPDEQKMLDESLSIDAQ